MLPHEIWCCIQEMHRNSNMKFSSQYEDLKTVGKGQSIEFAVLPDNRPKNRSVETFL
jgi:hypothetical protein